MLTACFIITHFPARCERQRLRHRRAQHHGAHHRPSPIIVFEPNSATPTVVDSTPEVPAKRGDSLVAARARCPDAVVVKEDSDHYRTQWTRVVKRLMQVADRVEDAQIGCAYISLVGLRKMYGNRENVLGAIMRAAPDWLPPRLGIAHGKFHARCAAMTAQPGIPNVLPDDIREASRAVASMSVGILPIETRHVLMLHDFGILTIGDISKQPMSAMQAQLGYPGKRAWELANGIDDERIIEMQQPASVAQAMQFQWPVVSIDALRFGIHAVMHDAFNSPVRADRAVGRVDLKLAMDEHPDWTLSRTFKQPVGDAENAGQLVMHAIEAALQDTPSPMQAPINAISIALAKLGPPRSEQGALWSEQRTGDLHTALRQLAARNDIPPLTKVVDVEPWSRIPERRQALAPVTSL